ncbi:MAG: hypothetical protein IH605_01765, partial [Burkholderiales bacterium]|nr:hypothetical protein [Burkholderiales bacterium]
RLNFGATPNAGSIQNYGQITTPSGGSVYLIAPEVENHGIINAPNGEVILAAGQTVQLLDTGTPGVKVDITGAEGNVTNLGEIVAEAGRIGMAGVLVKNSGELNASSVVKEGGRIFLKASKNLTLADSSQIKADAGEAGSGGNIFVWADDTARIDGSLSAEGGSQSGDGGFIETSGAHVKIADSARVRTLAPKGKAGTWLIDPNDYVVGEDGDIIGATLGTNLDGTNVEIQSSGGSAAGSGDVNVNDAVSWSADTTLTLTASNDVNVNASISATGASAGIAINPNTENGSEPASGTGTFNLASGASINLPNVSPSSTTAFVLGGTSYAVINSLGNAGQETTGEATLQGMAAPANLAGHYVLGSDIDAGATSGWNAGAGFVPIGSSDNFTGAFNGLGHTISGLTIDRPLENYVGLFGRTAAGAVLSNLGLVAGSVSGDNVVGGLVGYNYNGGTVSDSYATGSVSGAGNYVGGLVGYNGNGTVSNSYATGSVSGAGSYVGGLVGNNYNGGTVSNSYATGSVSGSFVGGLVGNNNSGTVSNSYATGSVSGDGDAVGGLVGYNGNGTVSNSYATGDVIRGQYSVGGLVGYNGNGTVSNSYATGSVNGDDNVGGLAGYNDNGTVSNSYATGSVSGAGSYTGGLVGYNGDGTVNASFWDTETSGQPTAGIGDDLTNAGATGVATAGMMTQATYTGAGWDFDSVWSIVAGKSYAYLKWRFPSAPLVVSGTLSATGLASNAALPVTLLVGGTQLAQASTGANGFYNALLDTAAVSAGEALLSYVPGAALDTAAPAGYARASDVADFTGMDLASGKFVASTTGTATVSNSMIAAAKGGIVDAGIPFTTSGNHLTLASGVSFETVSGTDFVLDGNIDVPSGTLTLFNDPVTLAADAELTAGSGDITFADTVSGAYALSVEAATGAINQTSGTIETASLHAKAATGITLTNLTAALSAVNTTSGDIDITTGGLTTVTSPYVSGYAIWNQATGGKVMLSANSMNFADPGLVAAAASVVLRPANDDNPIDLGAASPCTGECVSSALLLTSADLSRISAPMLEIGDNGSGGISSGSIAINAPIVFSSVDTLVLRSTGEILQDVLSPVTVNSLALDAGYDVDLQAANQVGTLAGSAYGNFIFTNAQPLTIGSVSGYDGVSVGRDFIDGGEGANIRIDVSSGSLTVNQPVSADASGGSVEPGVATVYLSATGITLNGDGGSGGTVTAVGGDAAQGGGLASITLNSKGGALVLDNEAELQAYGGYGWSDSGSAVWDEGCGCYTYPEGAGGKATIALDGGQISLSDSSWISATGGDSEYNQGGEA